MTSARCLVLGGSGVVGKSICEALLARGSKVVFTWRTGKASADALTALGAHALEVDLGRVAEVERAVDRACELLDGIDVFVHAAGAPFPTSDARDRHATMTAVDEEVWDRLFAVNVKSVYFACRRLAPRMRGGSIVLLGSVDGVKPLPGPVHHVASKAALRGLVSSLAKELGPAGVRVNQVAPGMLEAGLSRGVPEGIREDYLTHCGQKRAGRAAEVASLVVQLALDDTYVSGQTLVVDGAL